MEPLLTNVKSYDAVIYQYNKKMDKYIRPCLFGDGKLNKAIPIDSALSELSSFDSNLNSVNNLNAATLKKFPTYDTW